MALYQCLLYVGSFIVIQRKKMELELGKLEEIDFQLQYSQNKLNRQLTLLNSPNKNNMIIFASELFEFLEK